MQEEYQDPIMKKYADLIQANTKVFKRIFYGDPIRIGVSSLPALVISKVDTRVSNLTNMDDKHAVRISFTVVTDVRDTISEDKTMVSGVNALYNLMEGRNADYTLKTDSLLGVLRKNVELDVAHNLRTDLNTMTTVAYGMTMGKRQEASWSIEGTLEVTANFQQLR